MKTFYRNPRVFLVNEELSKNSILKSKEHLEWKESFRGNIFLNVRNMVQIPITL